MINGFSVATLYLMTVVLNISDDPGTMGREFSEIFINFLW